MSIKINLIVAGRFHADKLANILKNISNLKVYTSTLTSKWNISNIIFIPHFSILYQYITKLKPSRNFKDFSAIIFTILVSLFMRKKVDIVYAWATFGYEAMKKAKIDGSLLVLERSCPHVLFQQELLAKEAVNLNIKFSQSNKKFIKRCIDEYKLADIIVVPSEYTKKTFIDKGFSEKKIKIIRLGPNFYPKNFFIPKNIDKDKPFILGFVGGDVLRKGLFYLVNAWIGIGLDNATLKIKCSILELKKYPKLWQLIISQKNIEIVDYVNDMEEFYRSCDLFCLPSIDDGFGMVVFEAIACACPVIVSSNVGASDIVLENHTGFIIKPRDIKELKKRINDLYLDRNKLRDMSLNCNNFYHNYLTSNISYEKQIKSFITDIIKNES